MSTLIYCLSDKIANVFRAQLADTPISFSATDTEDLVSAVLSNNADFLLIQIQSDPAGYREKLMQLYMAGAKVHISLYFTSAKRISLHQALTRFQQTRISVMRRT